MRRDTITAEMLLQLPLTDVEKVTFFKRDEITTDLICCEVVATGQTWFFHEEASGWDQLIDHLKQLPGFCTEWQERVVLPPFAPFLFVAYERARNVGGEES